MNQLVSFSEAMADAGLAMHKPGLLGDGLLHRYRVDGDKAGSLNGWYVLHLDDKPFGAFGSWKTGQSCSWTAQQRETLSEAERLALQRRMVAAKAARDAEQIKVYADAGLRASKLWSRAVPATNDHPYLVRKAVAAYGLRLLRQQLVIPLRDVGGQLHTLQFIAPDGKKTFMTGGRKRGCYHAIGRVERVLCVGEGYATCATVHRCTGHAVAVAFDAGNLLPVAEILRRKFPSLPMVLIADNDSETPGNPGLTAARTAAEAVGAALAVPVFQ